MKINKKENLALLIIFLSIIILFSTSIFGENFGTQAAGSDPNNWTDEFKVSGGVLNFSNPNPANQSKNVSFSITTWNITIENLDGTTFNWTIELNNSNSSSGDNENNGSKICYVNLSRSSNYTVWVNATSSWLNETFWFTTDDPPETIVITLISQTPTNIRTNTTGPASFLFNITTNETAINNDSILFAYVVNHTELGINSLNSSYSLNDSWSIDKLRAYNRLTFPALEEKFNATAGDGTLGYIGEWNYHNLSRGNFTIDGWGPNWTRVNMTENPTTHMFSHIAHVDFDEIGVEDKTAQVKNIYKQNLMKAEFNMSDTEFFTDNHNNNTLFFLHFYATQVGANLRGLNVWFANSSYTTGNPTTSPYAELIDTIAPGESYEFTTKNSSYFHTTFVTNVTGYVGLVNMTEIFYIIFESIDSSPTKYWTVHFADNTIAKGALSFDFNKTGMMETSTNTGTSWIGTNGTPDVYFDWADAEENDTINYKLFANISDTVEQWSTIYVDAIDITNYHPSPANILIPNQTVNYKVNQTIIISYNWLGDPNLDTCWANITLWNWDTTAQIGWIQNRSITSAEYNNSFYYNWDTTGNSSGNYTIVVNTTDPYNLYAIGTSNVFNLSYNIAPAFSYEVPTNKSIVSQATNSVNVTILDPDGDTFNWTIEVSNGNSSSANDESNGSKSCSLNSLNFSTNYTWWANVTDGFNETNATYWFITEDQPLDTVVISLVSATNINASSDGFMTYVFNITTNSTAINNDSVLVATGVSPNASLVSYNWSFRIPASDIQPNKVRAHNRNQYYWFEKFNASGTGEIGTQGEWQVLTLNISTGVTVLDWGTNYTKIQYQPVSTNLFPQNWYIDRALMVHENKTDQYSLIYVGKMLKTKFNLSDIPPDTTENWDWINGTYHIHFNANSTTGTTPLNVYYANESFGNENPTTSPNAVFIGSVSPGDPYSFTRANSSYYGKQFTAVNQTVGTVNQTNLYYIVFTSDATYDEAWKLYYADNYTDSTPYIYDFANTSVAETSSTNGTSWLAFGNGTTENNTLYLKFDEGSGNNLVDSSEAYSGHYHNGTRQGATWNASGYEGTCLDFNGTTDYVNISSDEYLNFTTEMTIALWFNPIQLAITDYIISKEDSFRFGMGVDKNRPRFGFYRDGWREQQTDSDWIFDGDIWYHLAVTFNSSEPETMTYYVNGTKVYTKSGFTGIGNMDTGTGDIIVGLRYDLTNGILGSLDDVRLWQRVLSEDEINNVYMNTTRKGTPDTHVVFADSGNSDRVVYKVYANTTNGEEAWSITWQDIFNESNFPPNDVSVVAPVAGSSLYAVDNTTLILEWFGDPNYDDCWMNSTLEDENGNFIDWFENRSVPGWEQQATTTYSNYIIPSQWNLPVGQFQWNMTITDNKSVSTTNILKPYYITELKVQTPNPIDQSLNNSVPPSYFAIQVNHSYGEHFNITWKIDNHSEIVFNVTYVTTGNGTYYAYNTSWIENYSTDYSWSVCVNETNASGVPYWQNYSYVFRTEQAQPMNVLSPFPTNQSVGIVRPPINISAFINGTNINITYNYYNMTPWPNTTQLLYNWSNRNSGRYEVINLDAAANWSNSFIWGDTTYYWWANATNETGWVNKSYEYTTTGSRYDVTNSGDVISGDVSADWANRQGVEPYDGIYDVDSSGDIISSDLSLIWTNRT